MDKIRLLFMPTVDAGNTNAQSLNVREIALRLDPGRFSITLWYETEPDSRLRGHSNIGLLQLPARRKTWRILREMCSGYDIISYMDYSPASYAFVHLPAKVRARTRTVFHAEGSSASVVNPSRMLRFLYEGTFPFCDDYTAISDYIAQDVYHVIRREASHILRVGVDTKWFTPPERRSNPAPVILFAGAVMERKGPQYVLDAAVRFPHALFRLAGAGRDGFENMLLQRITQLDLKNVSLEGPKTQLQILEMMRSSDIFVLPSRLEGIPKVTLEAAATGMPCVVFRDYQTPSVIDGVTGFQVGTVEEMMEALGRLIGDQPLRQRMGSAATSHMLQNFDWDLVSQSWQNAYLEIAGGQTA